MVQCDICGDMVTLQSLAYALDGYICGECALKIMEDDTQGGDEEC